MVPGDVPSLLLALLYPILMPLLPVERLYWLYLLSALGVGAAVFFLKERPASRLGVRAFLRFCFPKRVYFHPSARVDYVYFLLNRPLYLLLVVPVALTSTPISAATVRALEAAFGNLEAVAESPAWASLLLTLAVVLAADLGIFLVHYLQHKLPMLWEFHKVHHSALVLTPITAYRMHPVDDLLTLGIIAPLTGVVDGVFTYGFGGGAAMITVMQLNVFLFTFYVLGFHLRHSHIWLSYGPLLSRVLISPAQHQIHHSMDPQHVDKNLGFIFAFWDLIAGTLFVPARESTLSYGVRRLEEREFSSAVRLFWRPFRNTFSVVRQAVRG